MTLKTKFKIALPLLGLFIALMITGWYLHGHTVAVLEPAGQVGQKERNLIVFALLLSLVVVVPVFVLLFSFAWRYRESNAHARYDPQLDHNRWAETTWWIIPSILIIILSVVTWNSSHALDPYKRLASSVKPLTIQVVALDWKWLFIYPDQNIAAVDLAEIPVNTPVTFHITSDAPMNSFWVPQLGGQIYAMPGMSTQLNLVANKAGSYNGFSANISGKGFAGMTFTIRAVNGGQFASWVTRAAQSPRSLTLQSYDELAQPTTKNPVSYYSSVRLGLYNTIVDKYMVPPSSVYGAMPGMSL